MTHYSQEVAIASLTLSIELTIRPARQQDLPRLEWSEEMRLYRNILLNAYRDHEAGNRLMLVATANDYPVGRLVIQLNAGNLSYANGYDRGYLYALHVMPPLQRHGIGTRLIEAAEAALIARGFRWSTIAVAKTNTRARRLYERLDYQVFREDPGRWSFIDPDGKIHHVNEPSWGMEKRLT